MLHFIKLNDNIANVNEIAAPIIPYFGIKNRFKIIFTTVAVIIEYSTPFGLPIDIRVAPFGPEKFVITAPIASILNVLDAEM